MPLAVTLRFDPEGSARVEAMRIALAANEPLVHPPHITLAVFTDDDEAAALADKLSLAVSEWTPMRVTFAGFGIFPGDPAILWLAPAPMTGLLDRHICISRLCPPAALHRHYRPEAWVPHVTLAQDLTLDGVTDAVRTCASHWEPFVASLDHVELVRFAPVSVIWSYRLRQNRQPCV